MSIESRIEEELDKLGDADERKKFIERYKALAYAAAAGSILAWRETERAYRTHKDDIRDKIAWSYLDGDLIENRVYEKAEFDIMVKAGSAIAAYDERHLAERETLIEARTVLKQNLVNAGLDPTEYGFYR